MKNVLKMSLMALMLSAIVSCKDEKKDDPEVTQKQKVEGEWKMNKLEQTGDARTENDSVAYTFINTGSNFTGTINFKSDNTYSGNLNFDFTFKVTQNGSTTTTTLDANFLDDPGTWKLEGNSKLVLDEGSEPFTFDIMSLTGSSMVLKGEEESMTTLNGDTVTERTVTVINLSK